MRVLAQFIMSGRLQAMLVAASSAVFSLLAPPVTSVLAYLGAGTLMLVTLRRGWLEGVLVTCGALLVTGVFAHLALGQSTVVMVATLVLWLPALLLAYSLRISRSLMRALQVAAGLGLAGVLLVYASLSNPAVSWQRLLEPLVRAALEQNDLGMDLQQQNQLLEQVSGLMTGTAAAALVFGLLLSLWLARAWQAQLYNPGGFRDEFHQLALPGSMSLLTLACLLSPSVLSGLWAELGLQLGIVLLVPFVFVGLAVVHGSAAKRGLAWYWLMAVYLLILVLPQAMVLLVVMGILDGWFHFRARVAGSGAG